MISFSAPPSPPYGCPDPPNTADMTTEEDEDEKSSGGGFGVSHTFSVPGGLFSLTRSDSKFDVASSEAVIAGCESIPTGTIKRLMAAVSFGYGLFHLAVSMLPPKLVNVVSFLGFEGDRQTGIQALLFARQGNDMRGPIAT